MLDRPLIRSTRFVARALRHEQAPLPPFEAQQQVAGLCGCGKRARNGALGEPQCLRGSAVLFVQLRQRVERCDFDAHVAGLRSERACLVEVLPRQFGVAGAARQRTDRKPQARTHRQVGNTSSVGGDRYEQLRLAVALGESRFVDASGQRQCEIPASQRPRLAVVT